MPYLKAYVLGTFDGVVLPSLAHFNVVAIFVLSINCLCLMCDEIGMRAMSIYLELYSNY